MDFTIDMNIRVDYGCKGIFGLQVATGDFVEEGLVVHDADVCWMLFCEVVLDVDSVLIQDRLSNLVLSETDGLGELGEGVLHPFVLIVREVRL
jgi:hypothetical protein